MAVKDHCFYTIDLAVTCYMSTTGWTIILTLLQCSSLTCIIIYIGLHSSCHALAVYRMNIITLLHCLLLLVTLLFILALHSRDGTGTDQHWREQTSMRIYTRGVILPLTPIQNEIFGCVREILCGTVSLDPLLVHIKQSWYQMQE